MAKNPNGKNEVKIFIPCCNDEELDITLRTSDNKFPYQVFNMMAERIGVKLNAKSADDLVTVNKGGGDLVEQSTDE